jgi:uncharacterized protein (TIGR02145 family)
MKNLTTIIYALIAITIANISNAQTMGNLALNATIDSYNGTNPANSVDGSSTTYWNLTSTGSYFIIINLGTPVDLDRIEMDWSTGITSINLQAYWDDQTGNGFWYDFGSITPISTSMTFTTTDLNDGDFWTKIRIDVTTSGSFKKLYELRAIGFQQTDYFVCGSALLDTRDGNVYRTVSISGQCWLKENLKYNYTNHSWFFEDNPSSYGQYGKYYDAPNVIISDVCPSGWRLPSYDELDGIGYQNMKPNGSFIANNSYTYPGWYKSYPGCFGCTPEYWFENGIVSHYMTNATNQIITRGTSTNYNSMHAGYFPLDSRVSIRCVKSSSYKNMVADTASINPLHEFGVFLPNGEKVSLNTLENSDEIKIFPNPNNGKFTIEFAFEENSITKLEIISVSGNVIYQMENLISGNIPINLTDINKGMYLIKITNEKRTLIKRFVLE